MDKLDILTSLIMELLKPGCIFKRIIITAARLEAFANKHFLAAFNLSITSLKILDMLSKCTGMTPTQLMEELACTKSNITQRLDVLEKNGFIQRIVPVGSRDKRRVMVQITALGKSTLAEVIVSMQKKGFEFETALGFNETAQCHDFLNKINELFHLYENETTH